ncbi:MAG: hypothetical protein JWQ73_1126 [Variovorax sp.]|jgi:hypothetical protein|nr:hypothetical protein [Variovorax sp.]
MLDQYRRLAVFVDRPSPGAFLWIVMESTEDPAVWLDLETGDDKFDNWIDAHEAGNAALLAYVEDELTGPANASPNNGDTDEEDD